MTETQGDTLIAMLQYSNDENVGTAAALARLQSHEAAAFVALAVLIGFVIVFGLIAAMQARPRSG